MRKGSTFIVDASTNYEGNSDDMETGSDVVGRSKNPTHVASFGVDVQLLKS